MDIKRILKYAAIITAFVIAGILIIVLNKFEYSVNYSKNERLELDFKKSIAIGDIIEITNSIYTDQMPIVRTIGEMEEVLSITVRNSTDEQNEELINKINEKFETNFTVSDLKLYYSSNVRGADIISPYIAPGIISILIILIFFAIRYRKLGRIKICGIVFGTVIGAEILYMALSSLFRMEINEASMAGGITIAIFCFIYMANNFEKMLGTK